jgi:hypothetical protein
VCGSDGRVRSSAGISFACVESGCVVFATRQRTALPIAMGLILRTPVHGKPRAPSRPRDARVSCNYFGLESCGRVASGDFISGERGGAPRGWGGFACLAGSGHHARLGRASAEQERDGTIPAAVGELEGDEVRKPRSIGSAGAFAVSDSRSFREAAGSC